MENNKINTWAELKTVINPKLISDITIQGQQGDPDWLHDILSEVSYTDHKSTFFIKGFHDTLKPYKLDIDNIDKTYRESL